MALSLMNVGEKAEVQIESRFAYGSLGLKNETNPEKSIPPNAKVLIHNFPLIIMCLYKFFLTD